MSPSKPSPPRNDPPVLEITARQLTFIVVAAIVVSAGLVVLGMFIERNEPELGAMVARTEPGADAVSDPADADPAGPGRQTSPRLDVRDGQAAPSASPASPGAGAPSSSDAVRYVDLREIASAGASPNVPPAVEQPPDEEPEPVEEPEPAAAPEAPQDGPPMPETPLEAPQDAPPTQETSRESTRVEPLTPPMGAELLDEPSPATPPAPEPTREEAPAPPSPAPASQGAHFGVQVAAVAIGADGPQAARRKAQDYIAQHPGLGATIVESADGKWVRIVAGRDADRAAANRRRTELNAQPAYQGCFVQAVP